MLVENKDAESLLICLEAHRKSIRSLVKAFADTELDAKTATFAVNKLIDNMTCDLNSYRWSEDSLYDDK